MSGHLQIRAALQELGYKQLRSNIEEAMAEYEHAMQQYKHTEGPNSKKIRFELYRAWAELAGCCWPTHKADMRFQVEGTTLHRLVKNNMPDIQQTV